MGHRGCARLREGLRPHRGPLESSRLSSSHQHHSPLAPYLCAGPAGDRAHHVHHPDPAGGRAGVHRGHRPPGAQAAGAHGGAGGWRVGGSLVGAWWGLGGDGGNSAASPPGPEPCLARPSASLTLSALLSPAPAHAHHQVREVSENPLASIKRAQHSGSGSVGSPSAGGALDAGGKGKKGKQGGEVQALETQVLEQSIHKICSLLSVRRPPTCLHPPPAPPLLRRSAPLVLAGSAAACRARRCCVSPALSYLSLLTAHAGGLWRGGRRGDCRQHQVWRRPEPHGARPQGGCGDSTCVGWVLRQAACTVRWACRPEDGRSRVWLKGAALCHSPTGGRHFRVLRHPRLHGWVTGWADARGCSSSAHACAGIQAPSAGRCRPLPAPSSPCPPRRPAPAAPCAPPLQTPPRCCRRT